MPYPFKNQFIATNPKSQHLDIADFIIGRQNYMKLKYKKKRKIMPYRRKWLNKVFEWRR